MRYVFPVDLSLAEVRGVITRANARLGMRGFYEAERPDGHSIINYLVAMPASFPEPNTGDAALDRDHAILRECRGLTFDLGTGLVRARKFHKFFNVGEKDETAARHVDWSRPHVVLDKLDGSMLTPLIGATGRVSWHTRLGATENAAVVGDFVDAAAARYVALAQAATEQGQTPIFEWCSRRHRIVVDYPQDRLVLTAVRDNRTGSYLSHAAMVGMASPFAVPVVSVLPDPVTDIAAFCAAIEDRMDIEGYVVRFDDGHMLKLKVPWYALRHRTRARLQQEKDVWDLVLNDQADDIKAFLDGRDVAALDGFIAAFNAGMARVAKRLGDRVERGRANVGGDRKRFAVDVVNLPDTTPTEKSLLFQIFGGVEPFEAVRSALRRSTSTEGRLDHMRPLCDGVRWDRFLRSAVTRED